MMKLIRFIPAALLFAGCALPIPSSIGMAMVDEIEMKMDDLAVGSLLTEECAAAGFDAESAPIANAVARLDSSRRSAFEDLRASAEARRIVDESLDADGCADFADNMRQIGGKPIVVR